MPYLLQASQTVAVPLWATLFIAFLSVSGTLFVGWLNRKRFSTLKAEDHKTDAEARRLEVQSISELYTQLRDTRAELAVIVAEATERAQEVRERHANQVEFLQGQIEARAASEAQAKGKEQVVRDRFHAASGELQRCILIIREYESVMSRCVPPVIFTPFDFKPYEEIMKAHGE